MSRKESFDPIEPAIEYFKELPIPKNLAEKVEVIDMDGGNEIFLNIIPQWDGEDDKVSKIFIQAGIEVEEL